MGNAVAPHQSDQPGIVNLDTANFMRDEKVFPSVICFESIGQQRRNAFNRAEPSASLIQRQPEAASRGCRTGANIPEFRPILKGTNGGVPLNLECSHGLANLLVLVCLPIHEPKEDACIQQITHQS
jgi:hypothetical protein